MARAASRPSEPPASAWRGGEVLPGQLKDLLRAGAVRVLDVRTDEEVRAWPFAGALHVPLQELPARAAGEVPGDAPLVTVCARGNRSRAAAEFLAGRGHRAASLQGGMAAWAATYDAATVAIDGGHLTQLRRLGKGCLTYVLEADGEAVAVDPTCHLEATLEVLRGRGLALRHVVDTHRHADHLSGAPELARATGAELHLSAADGYDPAVGARLGEGQEVAVGPREALRLDAVATPGHTPGSVSLRLADRAVLTGDTLFLDGHARPDLRDRATEHARVLHGTYRRIGEWPERLQVFPAHLSPRWPWRLGEVATRPLGEVRDGLRLFDLDEDAFVERVLARLPERPANYGDILERNRRGARCDPAEVEALESGGNQCVAG